MLLLAVVTHLLIARLPPPPPESTLMASLRVASSRGSEERWVLAGVVVMDVVDVMRVV